MDNPVPIRLKFKYRGDKRAKSVSGQKGGDSKRPGGSIKKKLGLAEKAKLPKPIPTYKLVDGLTGKAKLIHGRI